MGPMTTALRIAITPMPWIWRLRIPSPHLGRWLTLNVTERAHLSEHPGRGCIDRVVAWEGIEVWRGRCAIRGGGWRQAMLDEAWPLLSALVDGGARNDDGPWLSAGEVASWGH